MQTAYTAQAAAAVAGQLADCGFNDVESKVAEAACTFGLLCQRGTADNGVIPIAALPAADDDSIVATPLASAVTAQTFNLASLDGVWGDGPISPAQRLMFTWNNHADWIAGWLHVYGEGPGGYPLHEAIAVPVGGNTITYSYSVFKRVERIHMDAMAGTNGTLDVGTDPTYVAYDPVGYPGFICYDPAREEFAAATQVAANTQVSVMRRGRIWVPVEAAVTDGDPVFVRAVLAGANLRGQVRGTPAANFFPLPNAHFLSTQATATGVAVLELGG